MSKTSYNANVVRVRDSKYTITGWSIKIVKVPSLIHSISPLTFPRQLSFKDNVPAAFDQIKELGGVVPDSFYTCDISLTDKCLVFSGPTETSARIGMVEFFKLVNPKLKLTMRRKWVISLKKDESEESSDQFCLFDDSDSD